MPDPPDAFTNSEQHDFEEVAHEKLLDLENVTLYTIQSECTNEDCNGEKTSIEVVGNRPQTTSALKDVLYEVYESFYHNPRSIGYGTLATLVPEDEEFDFQLAKTDLLTDAVDLGVKDAREDKEKRSKMEFFDHILD